MNWATDAQIEENLTHPVQIIRLGTIVNYFFRMDYTQINRALNDPDKYIRMACINRTQGRLSSDQITQLINSDDWNIRKILAVQSFYLPTPQQMADGLSDESNFVRSVYIKRWHEWMSKHEYQGLKNRHSSIIIGCESPHAL